LDVSARQATFGSTTNICQKPTEEAVMVAVSVPRTKHNLRSYKKLVTTNEEPCKNMSVITKDTKGGLKTSKNVAGKK
jgi:hypothetical protein